MSAYNHIIYQNSVSVNPLTLFFAIFKSLFFIDKLERFTPLKPQITRFLVFGLR